ncbi:nucleotide-diphospho-sugar transferases superfamily protein [Actinidia rufa]|uniref:Nucleotide-diphospho-sugar transferases superfamily protein n=1 Tax=Actinidia rufa TaxID=165716 RepID=A0A7J0GX36_9ERIC|nr:nucleotide-diphospho-sugar transferases superfamily protein [Actinidia rufa]
MSSTLITIRDRAADAGGLYSPAKEKANNRGVYGVRSPLFRRRVRQLIGGPRVKLLLSLCIISFFVLFSSRIGTFKGWNPHASSSASSPSRLVALLPLFSHGSFSSTYALFARGYTVLINTWKRNSLLTQSVAHYASCSGTDAIHVVWSESDPPSNSLKAYLKKIVLKKSHTASKPNFKFDLNEEDNLNNRFKPIEDLRTDAIFSVDDDVIVPCHTLDFAFTVWQSAPLTMVGFVPRMHWLDQERNCEDIAMSLLVANATDAPPIWVKGLARVASVKVVPSQNFLCVVRGFAGKIYEIGSSGISRLKGHSNRRNKCLNDFVSLYGTMPLVPTNIKAVDAGHEWFW